MFGVVCFGLVISFLCFVSGGLCYVCVLCGVGCLGFEVDFAGIRCYCLFVLIACFVFRLCKLGWWGWVVRLGCCLDLSCFLGFDFKFVRVGLIACLFVYGLD